jgi:GT2 family glycosyltransferase
MNVRAVVLNWNSRRQTERCLDRLLASDGVELDVLVVDNGSDPAEAHALRQRLGEARVLRLDENRGYAGGMNAGMDFWLEQGDVGDVGDRRASGAPRAARRAHPPLPHVPHSPTPDVLHSPTPGKSPILLVTPDAELAPDAVALLLAELLRTPDAGIAGPAMYFAREPEPWVYEGGRVDARAGRAALLPGRADGEPRDVDYVDGCCMLIRAEVVEAGLRFDDDYFAYYEEMDFCRQAAAAGWRIRIVPAAEVDHPKDFADRPPHYFYYMARNRYRFWARNGGIPFLRVAVGLAAENARNWAMVPRALIDGSRGDWRTRLRFARLHTGGAVRGTRDYLAGRTGPMFGP